MRTARNPLEITALLALAAGLSACTAETAKQFEGPHQTVTQAWTSGQTLSVNGKNGQIRFQNGSAGEVRAVFKPFAFKGYTEKDQAFADMQQYVTFSLTKDASGNVLAASDNDGKGNLGGHIVVYVPPEFDSVINIQNGNGEIELDTVGQAQTLYVNNKGAGDCKIQGAASVTTTNVRCGFTTWVRGISDRADVVSDGIGDVTVSLVSIAPGSAGGTIMAQGGTVNLTLPSADGYSVQATSESGTVNEGALPSGCTVAVAGTGNNSKTVSCSSGRNYVAHASDDVNLYYQ